MRRRTAVRTASILLPAVAIAATGALLVWGLPSPVTPADRIERLPSDLFERPPLSGEIRLETPGDAELQRARLRKLIFGSARLPGGLPTVQRGIEDTEFADGLANLERIDRLEIRLALGFTSVAYHVVPRRPNGQLLIYHNGHGEDLLVGRTTVAYFLERGYALAVLAMPYAGLNTNPETVDTRCGRVELEFAGASSVHDSMACLPRPIRYFLEPVAIVLNYASRLGYERTAMVGLSGGGWTTMLYAAIDPRVQRSYPVAGSKPFHITARTCPGDTPETVPTCFGDIEQRLPDLFRIANHLELYTLGAWGPGRKQVTINNVYDSCCFSGTSYLEWRPQVQAALRRLGSGEYDAVGDTTHRGHIVSSFALSAIESDLEGG